MCMQHVKPPLARRSRISVGSGSSIITAVGIAAGVAIISPSSALPFFWYLGLCVISYWIFFGRVRPEVIWLYCAYSIGVIVLYLIQNYGLQIGRASCRERVESSLMEEAGSSIIDGTET